MTTDIQEITVSGEDVWKHILYKMCQSICVSDYLVLNLGN